MANIERTAELCPNPGQPQDAGAKPEPAPIKAPDGVEIDIVKPAQMTVRDSVRAALTAIQKYDEARSFFDAPGKPSSEIPTDLMLKAGSACIRAVREIAAHPAGQSTGQGAKTGGSVEVIERCLKLAQDAGLDNVTISGSVRHWQDIIAKLRQREFGDG